MNLSYDFIQGMNSDQLIEALGDNKPTIKPWNVFEWQASVPHPELRQVIMGTGKTPKEAIVNLCLTLNKKYYQRGGEVETR